jgi:hypothetical protein
VSRAILVLAAAAALLALTSAPVAQANPHAGYVVPFRAGDPSGGFEFINDSFDVTGLCIQHHTTRLRKPRGRLAVRNTRHRRRPE